MKIIIFGATGLVGAECVRQAIEDKNIEQITAITRRELDKNIVSEKLNVIIHTDFLNYDALSNIFANHQACIWALGISQNAVSEGEYIKITYDYAIAATKAMASINPEMRFIFVSGKGADSTETSRFLFARIKGKTENALIKESGLKEIYTVRPAGILSSQLPANKPWYERAMQPIGRVFNVIKPSLVISATNLARAILYIAKNGHHATLFENQDLRDIVSQNHLVE
jgi:uncharacterized protein YbjT (DUF2867 family)